ncbi:hypothetical protein FDECE_17539, partial [Fusarium decemcellulare]
MSNYNGRRGPNVSQYLRDLNAINRQEPSSNDEPFNMEEDLALFTNTQFFDFETGQNTDYQAHPVKVDMEAPPSTSPSDGMTPAPSVVGDLANFDFIQEARAGSALSSRPAISVLSAKSTATIQADRPARVWPAWDRDLDLSGWIEDGVYGAISRDLPTPITTSTATPAPYPSLPKSERPLPQASWPLLQHQPFFNPPCDFGFSDFANPYPSTPLNGFADGAQNFQSMQPNPSAAYQPVPQPQQQQPQQPHYGQQ